MRQGRRGGRALRYGKEIAIHYLLFYEVAPDYLERRGEFRAEHLALACEAVERGELLLGGALADPADSAVLLFDADSPEVPEAFAEADPYVLNGLVAKWSVRAWSTVVGPLAQAPVRQGRRMVRDESASTVSSEA